MSEQSTQAKTLKKLIGLPFGQFDCVSLAIEAQRVAFDKIVTLTCSTEWNNDNLQERTADIEKELPNYADEVKDPQIGDVALVKLAGYYHLMTFVERGHVLTIGLGGRSHIVRYTDKLKKRTLRFYRWRGD